MRMYVKQIHTENPNRSYFWAVRTAFFVQRPDQHQLPSATSIIPDTLETVEGCNSKEENQS